MSSGLKPDTTTTDPSGPKIEAIHKYKGTLVHTADWDPNIDWQGKRVAVIGSGASGVQITPQLVKGKLKVSLHAQ